MCMSVCAYLCAYVLVWAHALCTSAWPFDLLDVSVCTLYFMKIIPWPFCATQTYTVNHIKVNTSNWRGNHRRRSVMIEELLHAIVWLCKEFAQVYAYTSTDRRRQGNTTVWAGDEIKQTYFCIIILHFMDATCMS